MQKIEKNIASLRKAASSDEKKQALFVVMEPTVDAHGDFASPEEIEKACHNFNQLRPACNLAHVANTDMFYCLESYIAETDYSIGSEQILKGTWLMKIQVTDDDLWEAIKDGGFSGLSIGAKGFAEEVE